jgi:HAD superfamily phosphatase (TIGR01668 family)
MDPGRIRSLNLRGLLLDVDCTLKDHAASAFGAEVVTWIRELQSSGIQLCLLSNGGSRRVQRLAWMLDLPCVARACKPFPLSCRSAIRLLGLDRSRVGIVGDQLFADVLAGRLAGLFTILVTPTSRIEPWFTRLKRPLERRVLRAMGPAGVPMRTASEDQPL